MIKKSVFDSVQKILVKRRKLSPTFAYNLNELREHKAELYFSNQVDNEVVQGFLQKQSLLPSCPYCNDQLPVRKQGTWHSNVVGEVDKFYCKNCKKYFHFYPEKIDKNAGPCPKCGSNLILDWGFYTNKVGNRFKTWKCKSCGKQWRAPII